MFIRFLMVAFTVTLLLPLNQAVALEHLRGQTRIGVDNFDRLRGPDISGLMELGLEGRSPWSPSVLLGIGRSHAPPSPLLGLGLQYRVDVLHVIPYASCNTRLEGRQVAYRIGCGAGIDYLYQSNWFSSLESNVSYLTRDTGHYSFTIFVGIGYRYDMNALD